MCVVSFLETYNNLSFLRSASFHIVMERTLELEYKINKLSQVALEAIQSECSLAMDVDFIQLPEDCHKHLVDAYSRIKFPKKHSTLFVLPGSPFG